VPRVRDLRAVLDGHSILGYGMSLASRAGVSPMMKRRTLAVMGDGGFWHNGLLTGVQSRSSTATMRFCSS
jgi:TPP-dependent indolepyruvate ferredoxin oxidoreductase alpha subunit